MLRRTDWCGGTRTRDTRAGSVSRVNSLASLASRAGRVSGDNSPSPRSQTNACACTRVTDRFLAAAAQSQTSANMALKRARTLAGVRRLMDVLQCCTH
jgi:hypothetical protein